MNANVKIEPAAVASPTTPATPSRLSRIGTRLQQTLLQDLLPPLVILLLLHWGHPVHALAVLVIAQPGVEKPQEAVGIRTFFCRTHLKLVTEQARESSASPQWAPTTRTCTSGMVMLVGGCSLVVKSSGERLKLYL